jgi:uncharacterized 2Fe-2S/4Fe-4S cluster protein (DUF4445 family)
MHEPSGRSGTAARALAEQWDIDRRRRPTLLQLATALRKGKWQVTVALHRPANSARGARSSARLAGLHEGGLYGLAIDLGSTTIAAHLTTCRRRGLASSGIMNPQIRFGEDLMSRVSYAMMNPGGDRRDDPRRARGHRRPREIAAEAGIDPGLIFEAVSSATR